MIVSDNDDREYALKLVSDDGRQLEYLSEEFKNDKEIVLAALNNDATALEFVGDELLEDEDIVSVTAKEVSSDETDDEEEQVEQRKYLYNIEDTKYLNDDAFISKNRDDKFVIVKRFDEDIVIEGVDYVYPFLDGYAHLEYEEQEDLDIEEYIDAQGAKYTLAEGEIDELRHKYRESKGKQNLQDAKLISRVFISNLTEHAKVKDVSEDNSIVIDKYKIKIVDENRLLVEIDGCQYSSEVIVSEYTPSITAISILKNYLIVEIDIDDVSQFYIAIIEVVLDENSDDIELIKKYLEYSADNYEKINDKFKSDLDILEIVLSSIPEMIEYAPQEIKENQEIFEKYLLKTVSTYEYVSQDIVLNAREKILLEIKNNNININLIPDFLLQDREIASLLLYIAFEEDIDSILDDIEKFNVDTSLIKDGKNILDIAVKHGVSKEQFIILLEKGFDFKEEYFLQFLDDKNVELVELLLVKISRYDYTDFKENNLLEYLVLHNAKIESILFILEKGLKSDSVLFIALQNNNFDIFELLVKKGFDVNITNKEGMTLFDVSVGLVCHSEAEKDSEYEQVSSANHDLFVFNEDDDEEIEDNKSNKNSSYIDVGEGW